MPTDLGIGALGYVGYAKESSEGTRVAPVRFLAARSVSFNDSNDYLTPLQIRGTRDTVVAMPAPFVVQGTMEMDLPLQDVGHLFISAFAATVGSAAYSGGGYTHTLTPGDTSPTFSFETGTQNGALVMAYTGVRVNTLELKGTYGEIVTASLGLDGVGRAKQGSAATPTYSTYSDRPFSFAGSKVQIAGSDSAVVKEFTFNVNNNVEHIGTLRQTRNYYRVALGPREMGLSMSLDFQDSTEYDRLLNDTEFAVSLNMQTAFNAIGSGGNSPASLVVNLSRVKYRTVGLPLNAGDFLTQDVECTVLKPVAAAIGTVVFNTPDNLSVFNPTT